MIAKFSVVCFTVLIFLGCGQTTKEIKRASVTKEVAVIKAKQSKIDTLIWTTKFLRATEPGCKGRTNCNYVELLYPVFKDIPQLNGAIKNSVLEFLEVKKEEQGTIDKFFKRFSHDFLSDSDINSTERTSTFMSSLSVRPIEQDSAIVVIEFLNEMAGGAHPNSNYSFVNWNAKTDKIISLDDLLIDNYNKRFTKLAEEIFRKNAGLTSDAPLDNYNFDNGFMLNDNFKITSKGLYFFYNAYEIQAYGFGPTELLIPYSQIKSLLKPNTVLAQYIK